MRAVDLVMSMLQDRFPRQGSVQVSGGGWERLGVSAEPWRRGGTSPGGASFAGPIGADGQVPGVGQGNYFIGTAEQKVGVGMPHRAIWTLPPPGRERYLQAQTAGFVVDQTSATEVVLRPARPDDFAAYTSRVGGDTPLGVRTEVQGPFDGPPQPLRRMGGRMVAAQVRTRVIPMTVTLWCADIDDMDELASHLAGAAETMWQGACDQVPIVESGGTLPDDKGTNGLHHQMVINFFAPVVWAPMLERELLGFNVRLEF